MKTDYQPDCRTADHREYEEDFRWFRPEIADKLREATETAKTIYEARFIL